MRRAIIHHEQGLHIVRYLQTVRYNQHPALRDVWPASAMSTRLQAWIAKLTWELLGRTI